jgi:hypothetical protein
LAAGSAEFDDAAVFAGSTQAGLSASEAVLVVVQPSDESAAASAAAVPTKLDTRRRLPFTPNPRVWNTVDKL